MLAAPELNDYVLAVSEYVRQAPALSAGSSKSAQIALSAGLGRCLRRDLTAIMPGVDIHAGELTVAGALRSAQADVSQVHHLDGLRLAVELKPINRTCSA
jgi:hypothetical protein